jgi:hypothetical protein
MREKIPSGAIRIDCSCCQLPQRVKDRDGALPTLCDVCNQHQGRLPERRAERAEAHEEMLRVRLAACRASESKAKALADSAGERVASALGSRGSLADRLYEAAAQTGHNCPATRIGLESRTIEWARRHREALANNGYDEDFMPSPLR